MSIFKHQQNSLLGPESFRYYSAFLNQTNQSKNN